MAEKRKNSIIKEFNQNYIIEKLTNKYISNNKIKDLEAVIRKLYRSKKFIHVTTEKDSILESKKLKCSAGGLGAVVYAVPMYDTIHNLGEYIINNELPMFLKNNNKDKRIDMFLIEPAEIKFGIIDYLAFGELYYNIFKKSDYAINSEEIEKIKREEYKRIEEVCVATTIGQELFECINSSKLLKMITFETLLECLFMRQLKYHNEEMNNKDVKSLIYETSPELSKHFFSSNFLLKSEIFEKVKENRRFDVTNIEEYFIFLLKEKAKKYFTNNQLNLIGHIIYRYFDYRELFEQELAKIIWKEAQDNKISVLTYLLPKGEVGILPVKLTNVKIVDNYKGIIMAKDRADIRIERKLSTKYVMRNPVNRKRDFVLET